MLVVEHVTLPNNIIQHHFPGYPAAIKAEPSSALQIKGIYLQTLALNVVYMSRRGYVRITNNLTRVINKLQQNRS